MREALEQIDKIINQLNSIIKEQAELIAETDKLLTGKETKDGHSEKR
jgi:hypothetical protein